MPQIYTGPNYFRSFNTGSPYTLIQSYSTQSSKLNTANIEGGIVILNRPVLDFDVFAILL